MKVKKFKKVLKAFKLIGWLVVNFVMCIKLRFSRNKMKSEKIHYSENNVVYVESAKDRSELRWIIEKYLEENKFPIVFPVRIVLASCYKHFCMILKKEGKTIGFSIFYFNFSDLKLRTIHLGYYWIDPMHRGQGLGYFLLKSSLKYYKMVGFKGITLRVSIDNKSSLKTINKFNFKIIKKYYDEKLKAYRYFGVIYNDK